MLPISIGIFNQTSAAPATFQFNPSYDLISCNNLGVLGAKLSSYDGVLLPVLFPTDPFASNPNEIVVAPTGNLIQVPAGETITSCDMTIENNTVALVIHEIRTIPEVTPTMASGFCDHVMWTNNGNYNTHQARGGAGPPTGADDPSLTQQENEGEGEGEPEDPFFPVEPEDPFDPFDPIGGGLGGGGFGEDPLGGGATTSTTVDLMPLLNSTGDMTTALFWQWFAGGATANLQIGANTTLRCRFTASSNLGNKISLDLTWVAA